MALHYTLSQHFIRYLLVFCCCRGLTRCVFRDALWLAIVVMCGYLRYCHLPVRFDHSGPSPLTLFINKVFLPAELLLIGCFSHHTLQTLETVVRENPRSAVSEILKPPTIIPRSRSLRSHFFPILTFPLNNSWTSWPRMHAFIHLVAVTWLAD